MVKIFGRPGVGLPSVLCRLFFFSAILPVILGLPLEGDDVTFFGDVDNITSLNFLDRRVTGQGQTSLTAFNNVILGPTCQQSSLPTYFNQAFSSIQTINTKAIAGITTALAALNKDRSSFSDSEKRMIDLFTAIYGAYDPSSQDSVAFARTKLQHMLQFANIYDIGLKSGAMKITLLCLQNAWVLQRTTNGIYEYMVAGDPNGYTSFDAPICTHNSGGTPLAFSIRSRDQQRNYVTLCQSGLFQAGWPGLKLPQLEGASVADFKKAAEQKSGINTLDILAKKPRESTLIHELTHANSYFSSDFYHDDQNLNNGNKAYGWANIVELAREDRDKTDITKVRPLYNADSWTYFVVGTFIQNCYWDTGKCASEPSR